MNLFNDSKGIKPEKKKDFGTRVKKWLVKKIIHSLFNLIKWQSKRLKKKTKS